MVPEHRGQQLGVLFDSLELGEDFLLVHNTLLGLGLNFLSIIFRFLFKILLALFQLLVLYLQFFLLLFIFMILVFETSIFLLEIFNILNQNLVFVDLIIIIVVCFESLTEVFDCLIFCV